MSDFIIPIQLKVRIKDIDDEELEQYISDFRLGLSEAFSSSDVDDDHFSIAECRIDWLRILKEEGYND